MSGVHRSRLGASPFCHVEKREGERSRYFVVHGKAPRFVAEIEAVSDADGGPRRGVLRRVVIPNSWAGDYHLCGKQLEAAVAFFEASQSSEGAGPD